MFASAIQISAAAKCAAAGLWQPILGADSLLCFHQPTANHRQADSSETKQSTVINEDTFHLT